jgi:recombinational DNA repair ATPase RecF
MHHISELRIQGFKSISNATFPLSHYTPLVGYNNAGKTNILKAASWVIKKVSLAGEDFHNINNAVTVEAEISGITAEVLDALEAGHRTRIQPRSGRQDQDSTVPRSPQSTSIQYPFRSLEGGGWSDGLGAQSYRD